MTTICPWIYVWATYIGEVSTGNASPSTADDSTEMMVDAASTSFDALMDDANDDRMMVEASGGAGSGGIGSTVCVMAVG